MAAPGLSYGNREFWSLAAGMQTLSCGMWGLVPRPGMEPRPSAMGGQSLSHWITREVLLTVCLFFLIVFMDVFKSLWAQWSFKSAIYNSSEMLGVWNGKILKWGNMEKQDGFSGFPTGSVAKNPPANTGASRDMGLTPAWVGKIPWRRKWQVNPVFLPGKSHWQRSLAGYSPWGHRVRQDWSDWACTYADGF